MLFSRPWPGGHNSTWGEYIDAADRYMRLALKAQGQCRATLETLAAIKNPPVVIARQANVSHGPQQINNTVNLDKTFETGTRAPAAAGGGDTALEAMVEIDRPANQGGKGGIGAQCG
jgi:hypothetical protein